MRAPNEPCDATQIPFTPMPYSGATMMHAAQLNSSGSVRENPTTMTAMAIAVWSQSDHWSRRFTARGATVPATM